MNQGTRQYEIDSMTVTLTRGKEHPRVWRYVEDGYEEALSGLYLHKRVAVKLGDPERITVTIRRARGD